MLKLCIGLQNFDQIKEFLKVVHTTKTVRNKLEKLKNIGKVIFDIPFMIQSHAESMKKILGAL